MHRWLAVACATALAAVAAGAALAAPSAPAVTVTVVAKGLNNPRGLEVAPSGAVYVAEAGLAGKKCVEIEGNENCFGFSGSITRIKNGKQARVASKLLSVGGKDGSFAIGADDVAVGPGGKLFAIMGGAPLPNPAAIFGKEGARQFGALLSFGAGGKRVVADMKTVELRFNPDKQDVNPNPYAVVLVKDKPYVLDAGGNLLLTVAGGKAKLVTTIPPLAVGKKRVQSVPTSIAADGNGVLYVGELGGDGAPKGASRVFKIEPGKRPEVFATGFTAISGVAVDAEGNVYVTEMVKDFAKAEKGVFTGSLFKLGADGSRTELAKGKLNGVGGVAVAKDGTLFVSTYTVFPGRGQVVRVSA
jgi:hypothetical protein